MYLNTPKEVTSAHLIMPMRILKNAGDVSPALPDQAWDARYVRDG